MLRARLHLGGHAEHPGVLQAILGLEVVERFVEHEVRLAGDSGDPRLDPPIQGVQAFVEGLQVALVARRIGRIDLSQVRSHFRRDYPRVGRR
ncbi:hypothetical protein D9M71_305020 [compost metagenome]